MSGRQGNESARRRSIGKVQQSRTTRNQVDLPYMADELLLTLHDTTGADLKRDERVNALVDQAQQTTGHRLRTITKAPPAYGASHLTLRLQMEGVRSPIARPHRHHVKSAVDVINGRARTGVAEFQREGIRVVSAMPNWLVSSAPSVPPGGDGPASLPSPAPGGNGFWPFKVPDAGQAPGQLPGDAPGGHVVVAVLDTWPGRWRLQDAGMRYPDNGLLQQLAAGVIIDVPELAPPDDVPELFTHASADHGLFVMGVINSIAPHAELRLLHVLNENGHGRTDLILEGLDYCLALARSGQPVVVNLSLFLKIPHGSAVGSLDEGAAWRIAELIRNGAVVVAAAGNDSLGRQIHLPPRSPANCDGVLCVVATDREGKIASYSNGPGAAAGGLSVATYGGQAMLSGSRVVVPPGLDPRDGVVGVFAWPEVHPTGPNHSGWVYWSGTSFSTAVMSGIAANVLARNGIANDATRARKVFDKICAMGNEDQTLGCYYVSISQ